MKAYELLTGKTTAIIATATATAKGQSYTVKARIARGKNVNDRNTWQVEIRVFAPGEKWLQCHWFDCRAAVSDILSEVEGKFPHLNFEPTVCSNSET